jgi:hypothetical protein
MERSRLNENNGVWLKIAQVSESVVSNLVVTDNMLNTDGIRLLESRFLGVRADSRLILETLVKARETMSMG